MDKLLIFDFDDTIIKTSMEYEETNEEAARFIAETIGNPLMDAVVLRLHREIDLSLIAKYGFMSERYFLSWNEALHVISTVYGISVSESDSEKLRAIIQNLYDRAFSLLPYAIESIKELAEAGFRMVILTAGDQEIQEKRVKESGVYEFMEEVFIVPYKTPETLKEVLSKTGASRAAMIGNSLKSDVYPALENNILGIHVERDTWEADEHKIDSLHPKYVKLTSIKELPEFLHSYLAKSKVTV